MPPARPRPQADSASEGSSAAKEKITPTTTVVNGKRRTAGNTVAGSSLRDVITVAQNGTPIAGPGPEPTPGIQWASVDSQVLHAYRHEYRLNTPASFNKPANQVVLSQSPMGRMSPTMARHKQQRRQSKEQLANTVRKQFNSLAIVEIDVIVELMYKVRWQDKNFRMRFNPQRPRP